MTLLDATHRHGVRRVVSASSVLAMGWYEPVLDSADWAHAVEDDGAGMTTCRPPVTRPS